MMNNHNTFQAFFQSLAFLALAFFIQLGVEIVGIAVCISASVDMDDFSGTISYSEVYGQMEAASGQVMNLLEENTTFMMLLSVCAATACGLVFGLIYLHSLKKDIYFSERGYTPVKYLPFCIIGGVAVQFFASSLLTEIEFFCPQWFVEYKKMVEGLQIKGSLISMAYIGIIGPVSEEVIFRGAIFGKLRQCTTEKMANLLQALMFGLYHLNFIQGVYAFLLGYYLGEMRIKGESVYSSILVHMAFNLTSIAILYFLPEEMEGHLFFIFCIIFGALIGALCRLMMHRLHPKEKMFIE